MQMKSQLATMGVAGPLQTNAEVMKSMSRLVKSQEIQKSMMELSREMMKAGVIEEMLDDAKEQDEEETVDAAQEEVDKIITEITTGKKGDDLPDSDGGEGDAPAPVKIGETIVRSTDVISGVDGIISKEVILDTKDKTKSVKEGKTKRKRRQKLFTLDQIARM